MNRVNGQRVAVRTGSTLSYLYGDHLGSASLATSITGTLVSEQRYYPFGQVRWSSPTAMPTDRTFTGQRADSYSNILEMGARWYSPMLGRFLSPDSIVPRPSDPQSLNRYAYARNSPITRLDPTGHWDMSWDDVSDFAAGFGGALFGANISLAPVSGFEQRQKMADALFVTPGTDTNSDAYASGRIVGDVVATAQGAIEMFYGGTAAGGGVACAVLSAGACAPVTAVAVVAGTIELAHGATVIGTAASDATKWFAKTEGHHISTNKNYIAGGPME